MPSPLHVDLSGLAGRTVIVTGASSGIGRATATALAGAGAHVVLAVRDLARGQAVAAELRGHHQVRHLDLADLASVRRFAAETSGPVDVLVNNAGVSSPALQRTADGFEMSFGTNHLGHFALTTLLLPQVTSRVVTLASQAERMGRLDFDDLQWRRRPYRAARAYNDSKLANLLFTAELDRRLRAAASPVRALAAHPGLVITGMTAGPADQQGRRGAGDRLLHLVGQQPADGALPVLAAISADLPGGAFTGPRHLLHMRGGAQVIGRSVRARDLELAGRLWAASEEAVGQEAVGQDGAAGPAPQ